MHKVLHIVKTHRVAGAENHLFKLLPALGRRGFDVHLLNLIDRSKDDVPEQFNEKIQRLERRGVSVYFEDVINKFDIFSVKNIYHLVSGIDPDVVHTHLPYADLFGALASQLSGTEYIVSSRHYDYSFSGSEGLKYKIYYTPANFLHDKIIAISQRVVDLSVRIEGWNDQDVHKILYGCEDQQVDHSVARTKVLKEFDLPPESTILGTVARLIHWKGHRFAIRALRRLRDKGEDLYWLFIGSGSEREELEEMAVEHGVSDRLLFLGHRNDVPELMSAIDMMVHPTTGEAFGLIFLEAMTQGTPIVATNTGAIPEIVSDEETGLLVPPRDANALAQAISYLIERPDLLRKYGQKGRKRYEGHFTIDRMANEVGEVYKEILSA